jgi:hypothetical protein
MLPQLCRHHAQLLLGWAAVLERKSKTAGQIQHASYVSHNVNNIQELQLT